jgi:nucleoside-diphosphate-sugar epimerase
VTAGIVVVTGAAGFVGRALVRLLAESGARVRATDRVPEDRAFFGPLGVEYVVADITDEASLAPVFDGKVDRVFHLGAICNFTVPYERLRSVNVEGARRVAELSRRAGVRRFVHMSSTSVYGRYAGRPFAEESPRAPVDDYWRSKRDGEDEVFAVMREGLPVTVLRPCTIYGPGCTDGAGKAFSRRSSIAAIPGSGRQVLSNVRVEDVAAAAIYLSRRDEAIGQVYNLVDESHPTVEEALTLAAEVFGASRPRLRLPISAVASVARATTLAARITGDVPDLEYDAVKYLEDDYVVDGSKLRSTGFVARYPDFAESMRAMAPRGGHMKQVVVITGLAQGMGREVARVLAREGNTIAGFDIDEAGIASLRDELKGTGDHHLVRLNTTDRPGILRFRDEVLTKYGRVDTVLSNVGIGFFGPFEEVDLERALRCLEIDVIGTAAVFQAFIPSMRERRAGKLVAMSSLVGQIPFPFESIYTASKFAVEGLVQSIRYELEPFGIRVALIAPAQVSTTFAAKIHKLPAEGSPYRERVARFIKRDDELIKTAPTPEQAAEVICRVVRSADPPLHTQIDAMSTFFLGLNRALPAFLRDFILVNYMDIRT